jgi:hypothetical protein
MSVLHAMYAVCTSPLWLRLSMQNIPTPCYTSIRNVSDFHDDTRWWSSAKRQTREFSLEIMYDVEQILSAVVPAIFPLYLFLMHYYLHCCWSVMESRERCMLVPRRDAHNSNPLKILCLMVLLMSPTRNKREDSKQWVKESNNVRGCDGKCRGLIREKLIKMIEGW